uniref:NADH-ubiquinone oxidoreductase chain 5 n=1 Tax=Metacrangonyx remyi TaxID=931576 RepID=K7ZVX3_9CRUS|nr:NADH dehydrogenase subunit 5 [Metacrangonyx remyi]CCI69566.1 NADH dehydrogenase subunit 5 [Metacrangonyx remyi]
MEIKKYVYYAYTLSMIFISFVSGVTVIYLLNTNASVFLEWELFSFNGASIIFLVLLDVMSMSFMFTVSLISSIIFMYCKYYMEGEKFYKRFLILLFLFVVSMMFLILSPNLISILLGWDGLGLTSYILVIYYQNENSCNSGMLTLLSNRMGDSMLLMSICLMYSSNSWSFMLETTQNSLLLYLIIMSAMTKSAQIPFSAWLPAAMAAPTPVSALVHSSTLVTAGVYLLVRFYNCFYDYSIFMALLILSTLTMIMSSWMANFEMDMKKIIALSTLSQLGLMMMILSLGRPELAFLHLITHAMFKSSIFMCAGVMIHNMKGSQDLRLTSNFLQGGLFLGLFFSMTNMSLCGFPFLAGFFSKELLLENALSSSYNSIFLLFSLVGMSLTLSYSLRVMFFMSSKSILSSEGTISDMSPFLIKTMFVMLMMSVTSGFVFNWILTPSLILFVNLDYFYKTALPIFLAIFFFLNYSQMKSENLHYKFNLVLFNKGAHLMMYLPFISAQGSSNFSLKKSYALSKNIDSGWLEYFLGLQTYNYLSFFNYKFFSSQLSSFLKLFLIVLFITLLTLMIFF